MSFPRHALTLLFVGAASPALAFSDASEIPPPPYLVQPVVALLVFLAIFVGAAWSLSTLMGFNPRPARLKLWPKRPRF